MGCTETGVWEIDEEPSWWDEGADGPFSPFFTVTCISEGIAWPDYRLALADLADFFFPTDWEAVPPG